MNSLAFSSPSPPNLNRNPDPPVPAFDLPLSRACCDLCAATYTQPPTVSTPLAHALFTRSPDADFLAFRGSATLRDWLTDLNIAQVPFLSPLNPNLNLNLNPAPVPGRAASPSPPPTGPEIHTSSGPGFLGTTPSDPSATDSAMGDRTSVGGRPSAMGSRTSVESRTLAAASETAPASLSAEASAQAEGAMGSRTSAVGGRTAAHAGFARAIDSITPQLLDLCPPGAGHPVIVTGHSLGGALALLAARALFQGGVTVSAVYTFGGPRVGNRAWALDYDLFLGRLTWRVVDQLDLVPRVPFLGYRHAGNRVLIAADGRLLVNPPLARTLWNDALETLRAWRLRRLALLTDHPVAQYQQRLATA